MADLESVISDAIADLPDADTGDGGDAGGTGDGDSGTAQAAASTATVAEGSADIEDGQGSPAAAEGQTAAQEPQADGQPKPGEKPKNKGRLPYERHEAILANERQKHATALAERDARLQRLAPYEAPEFQNRLRAMEIAEQNPEQFLHLLAQNDARYARLLGTGSRGDQGGTASGVPGSVGEKPQPDIQFSDGRLGYSAEQQERLSEWYAKRERADLERQYAERFGPIEQEFQAAQVIRATVPRVQARIAEAEQWPGFNDNRDAIVAAMKADKRHTLESAYIAVVLPKLQSNRDTMRAELLAEINQKKPRAASGITGGGSAAAAASTGPRNLEDVIRESLSAA